MTSPTPIKVFVYGTLKKGEPNHKLLTNPANGKSQFLTTGKTVEKFPLVIGTRYYIPFLLNKKGIGNQVEGEIYEVDEMMFTKLDELEQYPQFYDREIQEIKTEDGSTLQCWLYLIRKFPEVMLSKKYLTSYKNSEEFPYCESEFDDPPLEDVFADMAVNYEGKLKDR